LRRQSLSRALPILLQFTIIVEKTAL
jgi:hypothetical protein